MIKYAPIVSCTAAKEIEWVTSHYPSWHTAKFVAQHKYDGANFQIIFSTDEENNVDIGYASRNEQLLLKDFNKYKQIVATDKYSDMLNNVVEYMKSNNVKTINLCGEIYGTVLNRINYYEPKESRDHNKLLFYDALIDKEYAPMEDFVKWTKQMRIPTVEILHEGSFEECMKLNTKDFKTSGNSIIEGVVIKPYNFKTDKLPMKYFKNVDEKYRVHEPKNPSGTIHPVEIYINENRAISAISKGSFYQDDMPTLTELVLADAFVDYLNEVPSAIKLDKCKKSLKKYLKKKIADIINQCEEFKRLPKREVL